MLKDGTWVPDEHSCDASIEMLEIAKTKFDKMHTDEEVIDLLQKMNDCPTTFDGRIDIIEWFEQFKKK
jgi:cyclopropane fatty-acyl-phospholipid synthase-like methyltransferase